MIYAMSDLHGCYDKYQKMLDIIGFGKDDTLYILGDIVDRGPDGIKILLDMMNRKNIVPILGNHDYMAYSVLKNADKNPKSDWWYRIRDDWRYNGGKQTEIAFEKLDKDVQKDILDYMVNFRVYETVTINGNTFIMTHAGISGFEDEKFFEDCDLFDFISGRMDYSKRYSDSYYIVSGHTLTVLIDQSYAGKIYKKNNHIAIDCGAVFSYPLGCICLDTMEEYYAE